MGGGAESHAICRKSSFSFTPGNLSNLRHWQFGEKTAELTIDFLWRYLGVGVGGGVAVRGKVRVGELLVREILT